MEMFRLYYSVQAAPLYRAAHLVLLLKEGHVVKARGREYRVCYENAAEETKIAELLATIEDSIEAAASALKEQKLIVTRKDDSYQIFQKPVEKSGKKGGKKNDEKYNFKIIPVIKVEDSRALQLMLNGQLVQHQFKVNIQDEESIQFLTSSRNFEAFITSLTENYIIELSLSGVKFGGNRLQKLTQALKSDGMHNIESLAFKDNGFTHYDIELLKDVFVGLEKLKNIEMTGHQFDHQALIHLINSLNNVVNLESLNLDNNGIGAAGIGGLFHFEDPAIKKIRGCTS